MKKLVSLFLALCMMVFALPVLAETSADTSTDASGLEALLSLFGSSEGQEGGSEGSEDLGSLLSLFGGSEGEDGSSEGGEGLGALLSLFGGSGEETTKETETAEAEGQGFDLSGLLGMLGITAATEDTFAAAESIEQFYGTWQLTKVKVAGYEMPLDAVKSLGLDLDIALLMNVSAEGIQMKVSETEGNNVAITDCELVDGVLNLKMDDDPAQMKLTDAGELCLSVGKTDSEGFEMHFAPVN